MCPETFWKHRQYIYPKEMLDAAGGTLSSVPISAVVGKTSVLGHSHVRTLLGLGLRGNGILGFREKWAFEPFVGCNFYTVFSPIERASAD